jgi:hypothetical protein
MADYGLVLVGFCLGWFVLSIFIAGKDDDE